MAQHVIPAAQLVPQYKTIGRCNNYAVLQKNGEQVETSNTPFVTLANIHTIEAFMNKVGYQAVVDKVSAFFTKNLAQPWQIMFKLIIADLMIKFPNIPKRLEEDYHSIKDDVPLVSVSTTRNVLVRGMLILDAFLTTKIPMNLRSTRRSPTVSASPSETKKRKKITGESSSSRKSLKVTIKQKEIVDAKKNDVDSEDRAKKDDEMGSLEIRNEETQTTISTPIRSPRKSLSSDKNIFQEMTGTVSIPITTTSKHSQVKKRISKKYSHLPGTLRRMCRCQGYMIQDMERKRVTTEIFWETHNKVDQVLKEVIP
ncbi:hypothetical protein Tco_0492413 [Tanacetum coccineum]